MSTATERVLSFRCGEAELLGVLHEPSAAAAPLGVLVVVGGPQYRVGSHRQFVLMARALASAGFPVFRFDYRGMGDSSGDAVGFEKVGADIRAAIDAFTSSATGVKGVVLWGLCDGASAILMHAAAGERVSGVVLVNPWVRTAAGQARSSLRHYYGQRLLQGSFWRKVIGGGFDVKASAASFIGTLKTGAAGGMESPSEHFIERMLQGLSRSRVPALVLCSTNDLTAKEFQDLCRSDARWAQAIERRGVKVLEVAGADHTFSSRASLDTASAACVAWLRSLTQHSSPALTRAVAD